MLCYAQVSLAQNALHFVESGASDFVVTTFPGITGTNPRTVEAWINTTANANPSQGGVQQIITDWGVFATGNRFTFCVLWNNAIRAEVSGSGLSGTIAVNDGLWHHVAVTYDPTASNQIALYVDGVLDVSGNLTVPINTLSGNMKIGQRMDATRHFDGAIDEVRVWNFAKTQAQIMSSMNGELCGNPTGLLAYYTFNHGMANGNNGTVRTLIDYSGNNYNGSLINFGLSGTTSNWVTGANLNIGSRSLTLAVNSCGSYVSPSGRYVFTASGTYNDTIFGTGGCDSTFTINLSVGNNTTGKLTVNSCAPYQSPSGKVLWTSTGIYKDTIQNVAGCDSILTVDLTVGAPNASSVTVQACDSIISPSGKFIWKNSGMFRDTILNASGCDSTIMIDLTLGASSRDSITVFSCEPYSSPSGKYLWGSSGMYRDTATNSSGCPDLLQIDLEVETIDTAVTFLRDTLTANASMASYQWLDCKSGFTPIPGEISRVFTPQISGQYAVAITQNTCIDTSACLEVMLAVGIDDWNFAQTVLLSPNPTSGILTIALGEVYPVVNVEVLDLTGKVLSKQQYLQANRMEMSTENVVPGHYVLKVTAGGQQAYLRLIIQ